VLLDSSQIAWGYAAGGGSVAVKAGDTASNTESFTGSGRGCTKLNTVVFAPSTVKGLKFKDVNANGVQDTSDPLETGLADFKFELKSGSTLVASAYSCGGTHTTCDVGVPFGTYTFPNVDPGTYTINEDLTGSPAGWDKVGALQNGSVTTTPSVTVVLGSNPAAVNYGNTPLSTIAVTFSPLTSPAKTAGAVTCSKSGTGITLTQSPTNTYTSGNLRLGTYTCTVVITDP
jgi:hypothetical protein